MELPGLLNFVLHFEPHYKACNFLNEKIAQVMLYCTLIALIFFFFWGCVGGGDNKFLVMQVHELH